MEERDDKAEKISTIQKHLLTATGSEAVRLNAQLAVVQSLEKGERLESYDEAAKRLGIAGPITPDVVIAQGIVRLVVRVTDGGLRIDRA